MSDEFSFTVHATDGEARLGEIATPRGVIRTPAFMPVGTAATVKAMHPEAVRALGADIVLSNTYHLMLAPGAERIAALGGLHKFMNWPHPILTDSGGFQVMSLAKLRKLSENGVTFQSHIDGSRHELTPERSMEIQRLLGSDIQMQFDECVRLPARTRRPSGRCACRCAGRSARRWPSASSRAGRSSASCRAGTEKDLRVESADALVDIGFHGYAIGGPGGRRAAGRDARDDRDGVIPHLPPDKPRYLMGVGTPDDLLQSLRRGVDMFDCVMPTRAGRHGLVFTRRGPHEPAQRALRRRSASDRSHVVVADGARLFARLLAPPRQVGRDPRHDGADRDQSRLLSGPDGGRAAGDRRRAARRLYRRAQRGWAEGEAERR